MIERRAPVPLGPFTLQEWDELVGYHLHAIEAGAEIIQSHVRQLLGVPEWQTRMGDNLDKTIAMLGNALLQAEKSRQELKGKPHVR